MHIGLHGFERGKIRDHVTDATASAGDISQVSTVNATDLAACIKYIKFGPDFGRMRRRLPIMSTHLLTKVRVAGNYPFQPSVLVMRMLSGLQKTPRLSPGPIRQIAYVLHYMLVSKDWRWDRQSSKADCYICPGKSPRLTIIKTLGSGNRITRCCSRPGRDISTTPMIGDHSSLVNHILKVLKLDCLHLLCPLPPPSQASPSAHREGYHPQRQHGTIKDDHRPWPYHLDELATDWDAYERGQARQEIQ
jgi:hypothetical protein